MAKREQTLLGEIERDLLDGRPLADVLRKVIVLGGRAGSREMRDWATRELEGYAGSEDPIPQYRAASAPITIDGTTINARITGQNIGSLALPDFAREHITERVELPFGVGELESLVRNSAKGEVIKLSPPMAADLVYYMNSEAENQFQQITALYWAVSPSTLQGVLDKIRTKLAELVAELNATLPAEQEQPDAAQAAAAVHFVVTGKRSNITVTSAQSTGSGNSTVTQSSSAPTSSDPPWWTLGRKIGAFVVGCAVIVGTVIAVLAYLY